MDEGKASLGRDLPCAAIRFVVDQSGELVFAERQIDGPTWLTGLGQVYRVTPTFTLRSEY
jgi:hypothetical protein